MIQWRIYKNFSHFRRFPWYDENNRLFLIERADRHVTGDQTRARGVALLLQKPLSKITISDITEDCGINRMTFYYHFKDIYDLVEWSCQEDASKALAGNKTYETWQQGFLQLFKAVQDNKPFIMNVYHSVSREQVENYLYKVTYDLLEGVVEEQAQGMSVRDEDKAFIATVYKYAFVGLMLDWIKNDMKGDSQLLVDRLELVIHGNVRAALERLRIDKA